MSRHEDLGPRARGPAGLRHDLRCLRAHHRANSHKYAGRGPRQCESGHPIGCPGMKPSAPERVALPVSGMTCAACARTIERTLTSTPGVVRVNVSLATNTATVEFDPRIVQVRDFVLAIEELGYGVPEKAAPPDAAEQGYRRRFIVAAIFAAPVLVLGMSHGMLHVPYSAWIQLALTLPVILYAGAPLYQAAWGAPRHGAAHTNSLIALGTGAAFLYSRSEEHTSELQSLR